MAGKFNPGPACSRKSVAARAAARQRATDLANVVDGHDGNFDRRWRIDSNLLNGDRRAPVLRITTVTGLKYDCYSALVNEYDDYRLALEVDYRYTRDASLPHPGLCCRGQEYEHYWLFQN